jgi:hypothetical protein
MYQAFGLRVFQLSVFRAATEPFVFPRDELVFAARREQADQCRLVAPPVTVLVQGVPSLTIDVRWMLLGPDSAQARMFALEAWLPHPGNWFLVRCTGPEWFHEEGRAAFLTALGSWHWYR